MARRFQAKPHIVTAVQWTGKNLEEIKEFLPEDEFASEDGGFLYVRNVHFDTAIYPVGWWVTLDQVGKRTMPEDDVEMKAGYDEIPEEVDPDAKVWCCACGWKTSDEEEIPGHRVGNVGLSGHPCDGMIKKYPAAFPRGQRVIREVAGEVIGMAEGGWPVVDWGHAEGGKLAQNPSFLHRLRKVDD